MTHLTPYTTKTYINFYPKNTGHGPRETSDEKMQNEPNLQINRQRRINNNNKLKIINNKLRGQISLHKMSKRSGDPPLADQDRRQSLSAEGGLRWVGLIYKKMQNEPNLRTDEHKCLCNKELRKYKSRQPCWFQQISKS